MYAGCKGKTLGLLLADITCLPSACVTISIHPVTQGKRVTYHLILTTNHPAHFHHSLTGLDGYAVSVSDYGVCAQTQFGLGGRWLVMTK